MLRATPGCRRISPTRSSMTTIWWTDGGLTPIVGEPVFSDPALRRILADAFVDFPGPIDPCFHRCAR
jgi:hypothetical protein